MTSRHESARACPVKTGGRKHSGITVSTDDTKLVTVGDRSTTWSPPGQEGAREKAPLVLGKYLYHFHLKYMWNASANKVIIEYF